MILFRQAPRLLCLFGFTAAAAFSSAATFESIAADLDTILARPAVAGNTWSVSFKNENGSTLYYDRTPGAGLKPASNTKMFTVAAAFGRLGTQHKFRTQIYRSAALDGAGKVTGNLTMIAEHDFTWSGNYYPTSRTPLDQMAQQLYDSGLRNITGNIYAKGYCVYAGVASNAEAAAQLKAALQAKGITVKGKTYGQTGFVPSGTLFTEWFSMPLELACKHLMKASHNVYADTLCRHLGYKINGTDSLTAGCSVITAWTASVGIGTSGFVIYDGSGLSHNNRISANQIDQLTRTMMTAYPTWDDTLAIGCVDGSLASRFCSTAGAGNVYGKTGTLTGVVALSGYIYNTNDSQNYLFSILANNVADSEATRVAVDDAVLVMSQSGIPGTQIQVVVDNGDPGYAEVGTWADSTGAGYYGTPSRYSTGGTGADTATWTGTLPQTGTYNVYAWYISGTNRAVDAPYTIAHAGGSSTVVVNQQSGGGGWRLLGTYSFSAGTPGSVTLSDNVAADKVVSSDAVRFALQ